MRHYLELKRSPGHLPMPQPLTLDQVDEFLGQGGDGQKSGRQSDRYAVEWH
jgi:hypothetical protein